MIHARTQKSKPARLMAERTSTARKKGDGRTTQQHPGRGVHTARQAALPHADALTERTSNDPWVLSSDYHEGEERAPALLDPTSSNLSAPPPLAPHARKKGDGRTTQQHPGRGVHTARQAALPHADALTERTSDDPLILIIGYHQGKEQAPDPKPRAKPPVF